MSWISGPKTFAGALRWRQRAQAHPEAGWHPPKPRDAQEKPAPPWTTFVRAHMDRKVACDVFTKTVLTARGPLTGQVLVFLHLGRRRVSCSAPTYALEPD